MTRISAAAATLLLLSTTGCVGAPPMAPAPSSGPAMAAYFDCVRDGGVAISAHRAVSALDQPENSIAAIEATGRAIPNAILELDAVLTKDRQLVLMHDDTMDRTTTGRGRVADLTLAQVKQARLKASDGALTRAAPPTLGEALDAAGRVEAIASIDLKPADGETTVDLARAVIDQVRQSRAGNRVILITYNDADARAVAAMAPEMMISAGLSGVEDLSGLNPAQILAWTGTREERPALWRALREAGVEVQFGTLGAEGVRRDDRYASDGDVSEYRDLVRQGVTVIATDTPLAVKSVLGAEVAKAATCARPR
ncbi:glycerophosphodiester phosphodiesterase [Brevundimonas sp. GW460-12-10-14-LB2]|jgi:glycerophosphoryl diester phosphodiesterase|uniref:glycerophosphodiester phosphodiesterase family protein n=1 Tax=Brevundimonas sp. GW460-12-10-14-LB2 TaxID=1827469 RepID=UPI0007BCC45A|nr:glycerophosphodiester phosphodiesterase family protein [Brevundimonas sp. GW460-12-10-14-LB2]ANC52942.1 glycerophosphodiester phosphodiesterase [Brevundimonas sp. GW460-12-10-14-LB2]MEA3473386.1 glycerophosphodiester phosphodiesterase family protein [Pseudomonadota bacterium]